MECPNQCGQKHVIVISSQDVVCCDNCGIVPKGLKKDQVSTLEKNRHIIIKDAKPGKPS